MKKIGLAFFLLFFLVFGFGERANAQPSHEIMISAAFSLKNAFEEIGKVFQEKYPKVKAVFNFGASGDLARQIEAGAPVDVYASAAQKDMDDLIIKGIIVVDSKVDFLSNTVVLLKPANSKLKLRSLKDLLRAEVKKIVIGNPKTVPAGRYAEESLKHFGLWEPLKNKLIFAENVRQALDYLARGEVDAGFVFSTDAQVRSKEVEIITTLSESSHQPIIYPIGIIKGTKEGTWSKKFIDFVMSKESQAILTRYGFRAVHSGR